MMTDVPEVPKKKHAGGRPRKNPATAAATAAAPAAPAPGSAEDIIALEAEMRNPEITTASSTMLDKLHARYTNVELKQLKIDLATAKATVDTLTSEGNTLTEKMATLTTVAVNHEKTVTRLEDEKTAYLAACPACVTKQNEIDRTAEPAAKWFAREAQLLADAETARLARQEDDRKRARFTELRTKVEVLILKYDGVIPGDALPGVPSYKKQQNYSEWSDEAKQTRSLSDADRRRFAQMEVNDNATFAEFASLKQELKDGAQWGQLLAAETMKLIYEEQREEEATRQREGLSPLDSPYRSKPVEFEERRFDQPKIRH
jgi:hypothetical protein